MLLTAAAPIQDSLLRVSWEVDGSDNELVEVVLEIVSASVASMTIIHSEERAFGPCLNLLLALGLDDIEDDGNPVLVVITDNPLIRVGRVSVNDAVSLQ